MPLINLFVCFSGDLGQTMNSLSTLQHYMKGEGQTVLFVGDLTYADRHIDEAPHEGGLRWDTWGRLVEPSTAYQPWIWTCGNHDIDYFPKLVINLYIFRNFFII